MSMCKQYSLTVYFSLSPFSVYPEITSDGQRQEYKREFDADLREYKHLCAEMDDISDQMNKLSRQLDTLDETSAQYQVRNQRETSGGFFYFNFKCYVVIF